MVDYNKYQDYVEQLARGVHQWHAHTFKGFLTNTAPNEATHDELADASEIAAGNGYPAGGVALDTVSLSESGGNAKVTIADEVIQAAGGSIGPFRYFGIHNDTSTTDKLVCWWDYGSSITLADTETFTADFDSTSGIWQLA